MNTSPGWYYIVASIVVIFGGSFIVAFIQTWWEDRQAEKRRIKDRTVCPAPAEDIKVCTCCRFEPETCGHDTEIKDRSWLREACVWCCDWKPKENKREG